MSKQQQEQEQFVLPAGHEVIRVTNNELNQYENGKLLPTAELIGYVHTDTVNDIPAAHIYQDAYVVPTADNVSASTSALKNEDHFVASLAARHGRYQSEEELEAIRRANQKINAIKYYENVAVEEANRRALARDRAMELGLLQRQTVAVHEKQVSQAVSRSEPEPFFKGTFGKEYEVTHYETNDNYETQDYQFQEYKSVYES